LIEQQPIQRLTAPKHTPATGGDAIEAADKCVNPQAIQQRRRNRLSLTSRTPRRTRKGFVLIEHDH